MDSSVPCWEELERELRRAIGTIITEHPVVSHIDAVRIKDLTIAAGIAARNGDRLKRWDSHDIRTE